MIELESLSISFGRGANRIDAVRGVSFAVAAGESFGLVGESGCGKSTILRAIAGLYRPSGGSIRLDGKPAGAARTKAQRRLAQMVFQDPYGSLNPTHTVDRILAEPLAIQGLGEVESRIPRALAEVGLGGEHRFRFPHQLSGGQRQRVAIARALIVEPRILLLDEPTSALDLSVQAEILNLLSRIRDSHGLTVLMVSHDLAVIAHMCSRIAVMFRGEIVETLAVEQLRRRAAGHAYTRSLLASSFETAIPAG
ncbi:MAG: ABC transporter ATP-binding protein [Alphaproteobacteria bacterium]|nr:ABC transporter ATP-binding protein [Alphaproteobacteria bacterium]